MAAMERKKVLDVTRVRPLIHGLRDELWPFAEAHVTAYETRATGPVALDDAITDVGADLNDAAEAVASFADGTPAYRAALVRLVARGIALLALDELKRGPKTIEREMERLGLDGYPKRTRA